MIGSRLAQYLILEKAGSGGMGVIYRARDETLHRDVALKVLPPGSAGHGTPREKLLREARASSALNHPNICTIYEVGESGEQAYIAMEYVEGEPVSHRIPADGLPTETVLDYGAQAAAALEHAHSRGILHRDLKSANVRVTPAGQLKVLDFGLAISIKDASLDGSTRATSLDLGASPIAGTLLYMAPEILRGDPADIRSDIWSLGVMLYELAAGALPFQGRTEFELTTAILRESPAPLSPRVPPGLRAIILRCLSKQPAQRYQHAGEVRAALEALQSQTGPVAGPVVSPARPWRMALLAAGSIVVLAVSAMFIFRRHAAAPALPAAAGGQLRLLISSEGFLDGPALSPDGKMVAYIEASGGRSQLLVSRVAGGERVRLTDDDSRIAGPQFSPDGERIAFTRRRPKAETSEICLIPSLGGEAQPLLSGARSPAWSADGSRLVFIIQKPREPEMLATSAVDGTDMRTLLQADAFFPFFGNPTWSPDGKTIGVTRSRGGANREIWLVPTAGGPGHRLTADPPGIFTDDAVFSPDGRGVVHRSNRGGASNLWWQPFDGGPPARITSGPGPDESPSIARDGVIGFRNSRSREVLFLYDLATRQVSTLLSDPSTLWSPAFSPDGREIAYSRNEPDGSWHVWVIPAGGGAPKQLTHGKVPEVYPRYAPDGATVFFNTWGSDPLSLWRAPRNGGPASPLKFQNASSDAYGDVSRDGRWFAFVRTEGGASRIYIVAADGSGQPRRLTESPSSIPRWSPDGNWIAFSPDRSFSGGIFIIHPDGTGLRRLTETGGWPAWWPGGKQVGFQAVGPDGNEQIRVYSFETSAVRTLPGLSFIGQNFPFDVSPDGKRLVSTNYVHVTDEIWLLEPSAKK